MFIWSFLQIMQGNIKFSQNLKLVMILSGSSLYLEAIVTSFLLPLLPYSRSYNLTSPISRVLIVQHLMFCSLTSPTCCNSPRKCTPLNCHIDNLLLGLLEGKINFFSMEEDSLVFIYFIIAKLFSLAAHPFMGLLNRALSARELTC